MNSVKIIDTAKMKTGYIVGESKSGKSHIIQWHNFEVEYVLKRKLDTKKYVVIK